MYTPKLKEEQIRKLYQLREEFKKGGKKITMAGMVREAVDKYISSLEIKKEHGEKKLKEL